MKKIIIALFTIALFTACTNDHLHFAKGVVVAHSADLAGVYLEVDTTFDGITDIDTQVVGPEMLRKYQKGDSVSVDVRERTSYSSPIIERTDP
jgi:hypothetical protein